MCGRFARSGPPIDYLPLVQPDGTVRRRVLIRITLPPQYNAAPTQQIAAVRIAAGSDLEVVPLRWGLIPSWAKDEQIASRQINARAETVASKPAFRAAFRQHRCLIPADGWYEWQALPGRKQPYFVRRKDRQPLLFAGLWEQWTSPTKAEVESCTILTVAADGPLKAIHDRSPLALHGPRALEWLDEDDPASLQALLQPVAAAEFEAYPVSPRVNRAGVEDPSLVQPFDPSTGELQ